MAPDGKSESGCFLESLGQASVMAAEVRGEEGAGTDGEIGPGLGGQVGLEAETEGNSGLHAEEGMQARAVCTDRSPAAAAAAVGLAPAGGGTSGSVGRFPGPNACTEAVSTGQQPSVGSSATPAPAAVAAPAQAPDLPPLQQQYQLSSRRECKVAGTSSPVPPAAAAAARFSAQPPHLADQAGAGSTSRPPNVPGSAAALAAAATMVAKGGGSSMPSGKRKKAKRVECVVCLDARAEVMLLPCKHMILCWGCSQLVQAAGKPCPICCSPVEQHVAALGPGVAAEVQGAVAVASCPAAPIAAAAAAVALGPAATAKVQGGAVAPAAAVQGTAAAGALPPPAAEIQGAAGALAPGVAAEVQGAAAAVASVPAAIAGAAAARAAAQKGGEVDYGSSSRWSHPSNISSSSSSGSSGIKVAGVQGEAGGGAGRRLGVAASAIASEVVQQQSERGVQPATVLLQNLVAGSADGGSSNQRGLQGLLPALMGMNIPIASSSNNSTSNSSSSGSSLGTGGIRGAVQPSIMQQALSNKSIWLPQNAMDGVAGPSVAAAAPEIAGAAALKGGGGAQEV